MRQIVVRPAGVVQLPGGGMVEIGVIPALRQRATGARVLPPATTPAPRPAPVAAATAAPQAIVATSVGLVPAAGTVVTSTPADLLAGPEAVIANFTIVSLDSGTW